VPPSNSRRRRRIGTPSTMRLRMRPSAIEYIKNTAQITATCRQAGVNAAMMQKVVMPR
jgi:hypothetical protein